MLRPGIINETALRAEISNARQEAFNKFHGTITAACRIYEKKGCDTFSFENAVMEAVPLVADLYESLVQTVINKIKR